MGNWKVTTGVTTEPITLAEAKLHLRVDNTDENGLITALISAARESAESYCCRVFSVQTITEVYDAFANPLALSVFPVASVASVKYLDVNNTEQTLPDTEYTVNLFEVPNCIYLKPNKSWPAIGTDINPVRVEYQAGLIPSAVAAPVKQAILLTIADLYENRTDYVKRLPTAVHRLLDPYRIFRY